MSLTFKNASRKETYAEEMGRTFGIEVQPVADPPGLQFAAVGWLVHQKVRDQGLGRELPTEWFLQDIRD